LINCSFCNRTFLPERLPIHNKICTAEKPFKPLPPKNQRGEARPPASNLASKGLPARGGGPSGGPSGSGMGGGKPQMGGGASKPTYKQQEQYDEEEYEQPAHKPTKPMGAKPQVGRGGPAKQPAYQQPEEEEEDYQQEEEEVYKKAKPVASKPKPMSNQGYSNQVMSLY